MTIFRSGKVFIALMTGIFILLILNIASYLNLYHNDLDVSNYFFRKTNFNIERNAPTIYSSCLHFIAAILMAYVAMSKLKIRNDKTFWWGMSFVLLFTGLDELLVFHEKLGRAVSESFETSGILFFAWIIPYIIGIIILLLLIFKPMLRLPKETMLKFIAGGGIFILGAVGIEMFTGWYIEENKLDLTKLLVIPDTFILSTIEEFLEMAGMAFYIYAVLEFIELYKVPKTRETGIS